jgi:phage-related baseplate assembly protein
MASSLLPFDLSLLPAPAAIEALDFPTLLANFKTQFAAYWARAQAIDPTLPAYDVSSLETDPASILGEAWSYLRLLDRQRVNDAVKAVLAPLATKTDLDNICARVGVQRLTLQAATDTTVAVMESDTQLLRRYLLAFDRPAAGSVDKYLYSAFTAWPAMLDAAVLGFETHGRRGDIDMPLIGPAGALPTGAQLAAVRAAVNATGVRAEATSVTVMAANRTLYAVNLVLTIPQGPDPATVAANAAAAVTAAANARMILGGQVPMDLLTGAAYVGGVLSVARVAPTADIPPDPYTVLVMSGLTITPNVLL